MCASKLTCSDCIRADPKCVWCTLPSNSSITRCDFVDRLLASGCPSMHLYMPTHSANVERDEELSANTDDNIEPIQMRPQRVSLRVRPRSPYNLNVQLTQALDYPVDLYYLMDLSKSMEDDKAKLAELGNILAQKMRNLTNNFRLGFGSFVDKIVMPYVSTVPEK